MTKVSHLVTLNPGPQPDAVVVFDVFSGSPLVSWKCTTRCSPAVRPSTAVRPIIDLAVLTPSEARRVNAIPMVVTARFVPPAGIHLAYAEWFDEAVNTILLQLLLPLAVSCA